MQFLKPSDCTCRFPRVHALNPTHHDFSCPAYSRLSAFTCEVEAVPLRLKALSPQQQDDEPEEYNYNE